MVWKTHFIVAATFRKRIEDEDLDEQARERTAALARRQADRFKRRHPDFSYEWFYGACGPTTGGSYRLTTAGTSGLAGCLIRVPSTRIPSARGRLFDIDRVMFRARGAAAGILELHCTQRLGFHAQEGVGGGAYPHRRRDAGLVLHAVAAERLTT